MKCKILNYENESYKQNLCYVHLSEKWDFSFLHEEEAFNYEYS